MARIDIGGPYQEYLESLVNAGLFRSITAAAEATIHKQMGEDEKMRLSSIGVALAKGEAAIQAGRAVAFAPNLLTEISKKGKQAAIDGKPVKRDVKK